MTFYAFARVEQAFFGLVFNLTTLFPLFMQKTKAGFSIGNAAILVIVILGVAAGLAVITGLPVNNVTSTNSSSSSTTEIGSQQNAAPQGLGSFQSYSELQSFIATNAKSAQQYSRSGGIFFGGPVMAGVTTLTQIVTQAGTTVNAAQSTPSYTGTNVQVQGVDEPDIVKTDGMHIFVSTSNAVTIINAYPPNSTSVLSTITFQNSNILGIEISPRTIFWSSTRGIQMQLTSTSCSITP